MVPTLALGPITAEIIAHGLVLLAGNLDHQLAVAAQQGQTCPEFVDILELIRGEKFGRSLLKKVGYDDAASVLPFKAHWESVKSPVVQDQASGSDTSTTRAVDGETVGAERERTESPAAGNPEPTFGSCPKCGEGPVSIAHGDPPVAYCANSHSWYARGA